MISIKNLAQSSGLILELSTIITPLSNAQSMFVIPLSFAISAMNLTFLVMVQGYRVF